MKEIKQDLVYVPMVADHIHHGHINIINIAKKYGYVVVGLMTDKGIESYKKIKPLVKYKDRKNLMKIFTNQNFYIDYYIIYINIQKNFYKLHFDKIRKIL